MKTKLYVLKRNLQLDDTKKKLVYNEHTRNLVAIWDKYHKVIPETPNTVVETASGKLRKLIGTQILFICVLSFVCGYFIASLNKDGAHVPRIKSG